MLHHSFSNQFWRWSVHFYPLLPIFPPLSLSARLARSLSLDPTRVRVNTPHFLSIFALPTSHSQRIRPLFAAQPPIVAVLCLRRHSRLCLLCVRALQVCSSKSCQVDRVMLEDSGAVLGAVQRAADSGKQPKMCSTLPLQLSVVLLI